MPSSTAAATDPRTPSRPPGVLVFISYAHVDDALRAALRAHLSALERERLVQAWDDREILAGDEWADEIDARLNQADVILLLVTADFINSQYCYGKELARALERHHDKTDRAIVVPVILRQCHWQNTLFAKLQALPRDARPISDWKTPDDFYTDVTQGLRKRLKRLIDADSPWSVRVLRRLRDPQWWQRPRVWASALGTAAVLAAAGGWWWQQATQADGQVAVALQDLRRGRYQDAATRVEPVCQAWVSGDACFVLAKVGLGIKLERQDDLEQFGAQVAALKTQRPGDPDLMFFAAQLALHEQQPEQQPERHAQAQADIARAIELTGGKFPEAHYALADLAMRAGRHADALPLLDRALDPAVNTVAPAHYLNARAYARAQTGNLPGAMQDYAQSARLGAILSRIEMAELLWTVSEFNPAIDQLQAARTDLDKGGPEALAGRNALPWTLQTEQGVVTLKGAEEKRCFARWMHLAGLALAGRAEPDTSPTWDGCGAQTTAIKSAVAASLARARGSGMNDTARERALAFASKLTP
jgi:tetratricopeptide (TPR) repeat protein